jgi:hypothetical protein
MKGGKNMARKYSNDTAPLAGNKEGSKALKILVYLGLIFGLTCLFIWDDAQVSNTVFNALEFIGMAAVAIIYPVVTGLVKMN